MPNAMCHDHVRMLLNQEHFKRYPHVSKLMLQSLAMTTILGSNNLDVHKIPLNSTDRLAGYGFPCALCKKIHRGNNKGDFPAEGFNKELPRIYRSVLLKPLNNSQPRNNRRQFFCGLLGLLELGHCQRAIHLFSMKTNAVTCLELI